MYKHYISIINPHDIPIHLLFTGGVSLSVGYINHISIKSHLIPTTSHCCWWFQPSEKYEFVSWDHYSLFPIYGKIIQMFQTTNQPLNPHSQPFLLVFSHHVSTETSMASSRICPMLTAGWKKIPDLLPMKFPILCKLVYSSNNYGL